MKSYETILEALNDLQRQGYTYDFNLQQDCLYCQPVDKRILPNEFEIKEIHRFEAMSDPSENAVLYVIDSPLHGIKGTMVNAFGIYSDTLSSELVKKINQRDPAAYP